MMNSIFQATIFDLDSLAPLFDAYRVFYGQKSDPDRAREFLLERFQNLDSVIFLFKTEAGKAIGFTQLYPSFSSVSMQKIWILNDLFVDPEHRKSKIGEKLIMEAVRFGKTTQAKKMVLQTGLENQIAQKLYTRLGWEKESQFVGYTLVL